jgi:glycosyltransferase involved in cell wall biosynthesis
MNARHASKKRVLHILHVTLGFYPAQAWGGPVKIVYQNGRELVRRGHRVTVYCTNLLNKRERIQPGTFEREIDGMRVVYFNTWNLRWWPGTLGPIWLPDLPNYLRREIASFDIVHLNGYRSPMLIPIARAARHCGVPLITQPHGTLPIIVNSFWIKRVYDWLFRHMELEGIGALIALQESERQQALAHGIPEDRIEIIPNGIEPLGLAQLPEPGSFRHRFGFALDRPLILFLGRINRKKGTDMLVEAFARLKGADVQLAIAGPDDGQLTEVKDLVRQYHLDDRVILPGLLSGQDVMAAFQDADLFVLPCRADTFPVTIMESCLAGTPMIVTDRCEIAHLVQDRVADVVPFDADMFAAAIEQLLTDRERYERYRANTQAVIADTFSIEAVVDRLEAVYERVIAERQQALNDS